VARGGSLQVFSVDGRRLEQTAEVALPFSGTGDALAWRRDGAALGYAGAGHALVFTPDLALTWKGEFDDAWDIAFAPDGSLLAVGDGSRGAAVPAEVLGTATADDLTLPEEAGFELDFDALLGELVADAGLSPAAILAADEIAPLPDDDLDTQLSLALSARMGDFDDWPPEPRAYLATRMVEREVGNGGFVQAVENARAFFPAAIEGYELLGRPELAQLLRHVLAGDPRSFDDDGVGLENDDLRIEFVRADRAAFSF
jgi:hypothetical protein